MRLHARHHTDTGYTLRKQKPPNIPGGLLLTILFSRA